MNETVQKYCARITIIVDFLIAVIELTLLFQNHSETAISVILLIVVVIFPLLFYYLFYSDKKGTLYPHNLTPRFPKLKRIRGWATLLVVIIICFTWFSIYYYPHLERKNKIIIVVAQLGGPDQDRYRINENILLNLRESLKAFNDIVVESLNDTITEQQGSSYAIELGQKYQASFVFWGWYGVTESDIELTLHIENTADIQTYSSRLYNEYQTHYEVGELKSFKVQQRYSTGLGSLMLFLSGVIRYEAYDFHESLKMMTLGLKSIQEKSYFVGKQYFYEYISSSYLINAEIDSALKYSDSAISIGSVESFVYCTRGVALGKLGRYQDAIESFDTGLKIDSTDCRILCNRGFTKYLMENYQGALADLNKSLVLRPDYYAALINRGVTLISINKYDDALIDLNHAIRVLPSWTIGYIDRGWAFYSQGDSTRGYADLIRAGQSHLNNMTTYGKIGDVFLKYGKYFDAIEYYNRSIQLDSNQAEVLNHCGLCLAILYRNEEALKYITQAIRIRPQYLDALDNKYLVLNTLGRFGDAASVLRSYLTLDPNNKLKHYQIGILYYQTHEYLLALNEYSKCVELDSSYAPAYNGCGISLGAMGNYNHAIIEFSKALSFDSSVANYYANRGMAYKDMKEFYRAIRDFNTALRLNQNCDRALFNRGEVYLFLGRTQEARRDWERTLVVSKDQDLQKLATQRLSLLDRNNN